MESGNSNWLFWTCVARLLNKTDEDGPPDMSQMESIEAVVGRLRNHSHKAANDMAACLAALVALLWLIAYAKTRAKFAHPGRFSHESTQAAFFEAIPLYPAWFRLFPLLLALDDLCQNEHLPTACTANRPTV